MSERYRHVGTNAAAIIFGAATLISLPGTSASAQERPRVIIGVDGGAVSGGERATQRSTFELNAEDADFRARHTLGTGGSLAVHGAIRVWQRLTIGAAGTYDIGSTTLAVDARLPHPLFFNRHRSVEGLLSDLDSSETGLDLRVGWLLPLSDRLTLHAAGGPSWVWLRHPVLRELRYSEAFPFNTATFTGGDTSRIRGSGPGIHAGVEVGWALSPHVGVELGASVRHVSVDLQPGNQPELRMSARRLRLRGGLRLAF